MTSSAVLFVGFLCRDTLHVGYCRFFARHCPLKSAARSTADLERSHHPQNRKNRGILVVVAASDAVLSSGTAICCRLIQLDDFVLISKECNNGKEQPMGFKFCTSGLSSDLLLIIFLKFIFGCLCG